MLSLEWFSKPLKQFRYPLAVIYRFVAAFIVGYICTLYFSDLGTLLFQPALAKAEAIFLSAFISLLFFTLFIITSFCIQSLVKLTIFCLTLFSALFLLSLFIG